MNPPMVLVVDDEENIAHFLKDFLEESGFSVFTAPDAGKGLAAAVEKNPDVILLDVGLPDMSGYELCRRLRQKLSLRNKPILMLTAYGDQQAELTGLKAGADDYLTKPINTGRLLARINAAMHRNIRELDANPLTHLPGNTSIVQEIEKNIEAKAAFAVVYADLNSFKAFNDHYGFLRGDSAIKLAAQCLVGAVEAFGKSGPAFVGHVGGDDFVCVVPDADAEKICRQVISHFDALVSNLYDEADRSRGHIDGKNRQGQEVRFPLMGIALAIVSSTDRPFAHPGEISSLASELKTYVKTFAKSAYVTDRRKNERRDLPAPGGEGTS